MNLKLRKSLFVLLIFTIIITFITSIGTAASVNTISKEELKKILDKEDVSILDVRQGRDWGSSEFKIKGADRVSPEDFSVWANIYPKGNTLVLYCA